MFGPYKMWPTREEGGVGGGGDLMETQYDRHQTLQQYYKEHFVKVSTGHVWAGLRGAETWIIKNPVLLNLAENSLGIKWTKQQLLNVALSASPVFSKNNSSESDRSNNRMHQCENHLFLSLWDHIHTYKSGSSRVWEGLFLSFTAPELY